MWDVIVVGARCAGATTALRFARSGRSVLMLDKGAPGSHILSTHILVTSALVTLRNLGLLDAVLATGAPPIHTLLQEDNDGTAYAIPFGALDPDHHLCVRRETLDPILVNAAQEAGVTVRYNSRVQALLYEDGRVVGVRVREKDGSIREERARLVVGADGRHSVVAQAVKASEYNIVPCESGAYYAYFRGIGVTRAGADVLHFAAGPGCDVLCSPTNGDLHIALIIVSAEEFDTMDADAFEARLRTIPGMLPRMTDAKRVTRLYPASPRELRGYFRAPYGAGWALVGDAGYFAHPATAGGIAVSFRAGELLHQYVEQAWAEGKPAEAYLDQFHEQRDEENTGEFFFSYRLSKINPLTDPEVAAAFRGGVEPMPKTV